MPSLTKAQLDAAVLAEIAKGTERRTFKRVIGAPEKDIAAAIQRLRWSGRVRLDRLVINDIATVSTDIGEAINEAIAAVPPLDELTTEALVLIRRPQQAGSPAPGHIRIPIKTLTNIAAEADAPLPASIAKDAGALVIEDRSPAPSLADVVKAEAAERGRRRKAARTMGVGPKTQLSVVEQVQSAMLETPADVIAMMQRAYSELWQRVIVAARKEGVSPVRKLIAAVEEGLSA